MSSSSETEKRRLHSDRPFWARTPHITVKVEAAPAHQHYDVIIVGAGISGALVAEALADGKRKILVAERRQPVRGSSLASTAMIQHEIDIPLHSLARQIGEKDAKRAWRRSARAVHDLESTVRRLGIDCGFEPRRALYLAGDEFGSRALATEATMRREAGLEADYLSGSEVMERFGINRTAAICSVDSASGNPAQLTAALLKAAAREGAETVAPLEITDFREIGDMVAVSTADGRLLTAGDLVFCSGYEYPKMMESRSHRIISTWALASEPHIARPDWLDRHVVWEASDPYLYFRTTPGGRVIAGGEDEDDPEAFSDTDKGARKYARIVEKLGDLCGVRIGRPAYHWAAPFGTTTTGLPIIDLAPGMSHVHAVMGFGGNGITFSTIASQIIAARIGGSPDPDEDLFKYPTD